MRGYIILRYVGLAMLFNAVLMFISAMVSLFNGIDTGFFPLLLSFLLTTVMGLFPLIFVSSDPDIKNKESFVIVVGAWGVSCLVGMLPYILWGGEFTLVNSWFESVSGYTTTGSTILQNVEALPNGLLFWRSSTHLIGGAGIVLFALVIMPSLGKAKVSLSSVEISSFAKDNYNYRIQKTVRIILVVYLSLISTETVALRIAGMDWFDAINHSFSTIATGGFSTKNLSIAYYNNIWIEVVIMFYMILSGLHFGLLFATITTKRNNIGRSEVAKFYLLSAAVGIALVTLNLWTSNTYNFLDSLRYGSFQLCAVISTTGFATIDSGLWPAFSVLLIMYMTMQCACAGSTSGGIKSDRILLLFKALKGRFLQQQHPNAIIRIKLNNVNVPSEMISSALLFLSLYMLTILIASMILTFMGLDLITSLSAVIACIGNVGPGFGEVSSLSNFASLPEAAKIVCSITMLAGRLELFGFLQLFLFKSWK